MKKSLIFKILYLFLILIVVAGASVFATNTYLASQVSYGSTNVEDALNGLFTLKGNDENYSTEEKVVGKWIDNKPIYRKVVSIPSGATDSGTVNSIGDYSWVEHFIRADIMYDSGNAVSSVFCRSEGTTGLKLWCSEGATLARILIIEYTKTTDTPINN